MADTTFTGGSPASAQAEPVPSLDQPKKGKPKSTNARGKQPTAPASLESPQAAKIRASMSPLPAPQKSPKLKLSMSPKAAKPQNPKPQNPTMLNMVLEALKDNKSPKGLTVQGIKRYITDKYPHTKETFSNARFRQALTKGMESKDILRPKSSEDSGLKGYFILNRTLNSQKDKVKPKEPKAKKSAGSEEKVKPAAKVAKKAKSVLNTSGSAKTDSTKTKTAKKLASKSEPKATKTKPAKSKSEPRTALKKTTVKKTPVKKAPLKKTPTKKTPTKKTPTKKTPLKMTAVKNSLKSTSTPKATATPKLSKSIKAGSRQKTAAVKKLMKTAE